MKLLMAYSVWHFKMRIEVCRLKQLVEEHQITITEYKHLLSTNEERVTMLLAKNQQLKESLAEAEVRLAIKY